MPAKVLARNWLFTINNPTEADMPSLDWSDASYIVYQKEAGIEATTHFQGYIEFSKRKSLAAVKKINGRAHWEPRKGTQQQAVDYCTKEETRLETPVVLGERKNQGKRSDLEEIGDMCKEGATLKEIASEFPGQYIRYGRGIRDFKLLFAEPYEHNDVRGIWYYGAPGTGKSRSAAEQWPDAYRKQQNKWFDGYDNEETVLLDDLDTDSLGHHLKIWADRYACTGETKGGQINLRHHRLVVTSNYSIEELFREKGEAMIEALKRRFKVTEFKKLGEKKTYKSMLIKP